VTGALTYLAVCSIRNGIVVRLRRLRQVRYMLIAAGVVLYFGMMVVNRARSGGWNIPANYEQLAMWVMAGGFFAMMVLSWVVSGPASLKFTVTDVHFLFPAPIARRQLLAYKIAVLLLGACGSALFLALVAGPPRVFAGLQFTGKTTLIMAVLGLHEAGVSLYRISRKERGALSARRDLLVLLPALSLMALSAWVLMRFAFADSAAEFLGFASVVVLLLVAHVVWVLRSDAAFEEQAAINAAQIRDAAAAIRKGRARPNANRSTPFRLAPTGRPEMAILWKNWLLVGRTPRRLIVTLAFSILLVGGGFLAAGGSAAKRDVIPVLLLLIVAFAVTLGPLMARWDLRQDLAHLVVLKTWPISGATIVRGEILAPALALAVGATICTVLGGLLAPGWILMGEATVLGRLSFIAAMTCASIALIVTQLVIHNAIAVTFPAWVRISPNAGTGGVETTGQMMVVMYGGLLVLLLACAVPAIAAGGVLFLLGGILLPAVTFSALLLLESYAATEIVGRILDRTDLQDVEISR
jgi:hypothetical protein